MEQASNCYVLMTASSKEEEVCRFLNENEGIDAFSPKMEFYHRVADEIRLKTLFPGYIFVLTTLNQKEADERFRHFPLKNTSFKELKYEGVSALKPEEKQILRMLLDEKRILRMSKGILLNKKLHVLEGPLTGMDEYIIKYDKHNRLATLNLTFLDQRWVVGVLCKENAR
jgi:transcription antitermination factor NusG